MRVGWYQRYRNEYARLKTSGKNHEEANRMVIQMLRSEK